MPSQQGLGRDDRRPLGPQFPPSAIWLERPGGRAGRLGSADDLLRVAPGALGSSRAGTPSLASGVDSSGNSKEQQPEGIQNWGRLHSVWVRPTSIGNQRRCPQIQFPGSTRAEKPIRFSSVVSTETNLQYSVSRVQFPRPYVLLFASVVLFATGFFGPLPCPLGECRTQVLPHFR
jgi:hypothetical protein